MAGTTGVSASVSEFGKLGAAERTEAIGTQIQDAVRSVLGKDVDPGEPLMEAGLDSLGAVELRNYMERSLAIELPGTLIFDYPSVDAMVAFAAVILAPEKEAEPLEAPVAQVETSPSTAAELRAVAAGNTPPGTLCSLEGGIGGVAAGG